MSTIWGFLGLVCFHAVRRFESFLVHLRFDSLLGKRLCSLTVKHRSFKSGNIGSNPVGVINGEIVQRIKKGML